MNVANTVLKATPIKSALQQAHAICKVVNRCTLATAALVYADRCRSKARGVLAIWLVMQLKVVIATWGELHQQILCNNS
jgi:hypothetical protein